MPLTPDDLYLRAVAAQRALPIPAFVTYITAYRADGARIACIDGALRTSFEGHRSAASYRVSFRSSNDAARSIDRATNDACSGFPLISPSGGEIAKLAEPAAPSGTHAAEGGTTIPTIGSVVVRSALHYRVIASTSETLGNVPVYHLTLRALADPVTYPLTDLYVDATTFVVRRIVATFTDTFGGVPATIAATGDFTQQGAYWVETSEHVELRAPTEPEATHATIDATASGFAFPTAAPPELTP